MIKVLFIIFLLLLSVAIGTGLQLDPGYILISFHHWSIETNLIAALLILLLLFTIVYVFFSVLIGILKSPGRFSRWIQKRQAVKAEKKLALSCTLGLEMQHFRETGQWQALLEKLPLYKKTLQLSKTGFIELEKECYTNAMLDKMKSQQWPLVEQYWVNLPRSLRGDAVIFAIYVKALLKQENYAAAEPLLRQYLRKKPNEPLLDLYSQLPAEQLNSSFIQSLMKGKKSSPATLLCLARISKNQQLWGRAKSYIEESLELQESPASYAELGYLLERMGDHAGACEAYRKGLLLGDQG